MFKHPGEVKKTKQLIPPKNNPKVKKPYRGYLGFKRHKYQCDVNDDKPENTSNYHYEGSYDKEGKRNGWGKSWYPNGDFYNGFYKAGVRSKRGIYVYKKNGHYIGEWSGGMRHGMGAYFFIDGSIYIGNWFEDQRVGRGEYYYKNNDYFIGQFENNIRHGRGRFYHVQKDIMFKGRWINNKRQPNGEVLKNGSFSRPNKRPNNVWNRIDELRNYPKAYDSVTSLDGSFEEEVKVKEEKVINEKKLRINNDLKPQMSKRNSLNSDINIPSFFVKKKKKEIKEIKEFATPPSTFGRHTSLK